MKKGINLFTCASLLFAAGTLHSQVHVRGGFNFEKVTEATISFSDPNNSSIGFGEGGFTGSAFSVPLSVGLSKGDVYDMGIGLQIGSGSIESNGQKTKYGQTVPYFYVDYYLFPIGDYVKVGFGAQVRYGKSTLDRTFSIPFDDGSGILADTPFKTSTTWGRLGYRVQFNARYTSDDQKGAMGLHIGYQFDAGHLKSMSVNGVDVDVESNSLSNTFDVTSTSIMVSYTRFFGGE